MGCDAGGKSLETAGMQVLLAVAPPLRQFRTHALVKVVKPLSILAWAAAFEGRLRATTVAVLFRIHILLVHSIRHTAPFHFMFYRY